MPIDEEGMAKLAIMIAANNPTGIVSYDDLRQRVPNMVALDAADLTPSQARNGEPMWHQIFRNIKSHSDTPGNAIYDGRLLHVPDVGYKLTTHGRNWLAANS
ncbi:MAG: hypothetical protein AABZ76_19110 [Pseudomonadota bacterium]|uniref:hypothetical protein n=1 Tax=Sphingobium TaxID=165695 RepID=UPI00137695FA|nr:MULTISPECIES: hypothetical protein [Sphingobium]MBR2270355.1 hypothetical protein [Sphingobium sp.]NBB40590.1 hypothetical protein [Sphingobium yanoikuyae]